MLDTAQMIFSVFFDGGLQNAIRKAYSQLLANNLNNSTVTKLFSTEFWSDAAASFIRNSGKLTWELYRAGTLDLLHKMINDSKASMRLIIRLPVPYLIPSTSQQTFPLPDQFSIQIGSKRITTAIQIGSGQGFSGSLFGIAIQKRPGTPVNPLFRMDYDHWHYGAADDHVDQPQGRILGYEWLDRPSQQNFHYYVNWYR